MTRLSIVIPVEGPCWTTTDPPHEVAERELKTEALSVVSCRMLLPIYVMYIDDWGATDVNGPVLPINRRAWALYGGSPIHGLAVICRDDGMDASIDLFEQINGDDFPSAAINAQMDAFLENDAQ